MDRFNIDVAIPHLKLAIEVQGGHWHTSPRHVEQERRKSEHLQANGWSLVELWGSPDEIEQGARDLAGQLIATH
jgi:very-short-patch-repair endonuclease